ncbi:MAG: hypothetical protein L3J51_01490 [Cocleimonas sp.]|nr:hypothetical protein [Cocleimonas sp.]
MKLNGNDIMALIGLPESDDSVLDLIEALGVERPVANEYGNSEGIDLEDTLGLSLGFSQERVTAKQKKDPAGGFYLDIIDFLYTFETLPFGIDADDNLLTVAKKIGNPVIYKPTDKEDNSRYWVDKEKGYRMQILFEDEKFEEVYGVVFYTYRPPSTFDWIIDEK